MKHSILKSKTSAFQRRYLIGWLIAGVSLFLLTTCKHKTKAEAEANPAQSIFIQPTPTEAPLAHVLVSKVIPIHHFFQYLEQIVQQYDTLSAYNLSENLLLRANPWILDSLVQTDYYYQASMGHFVYNQPEMLILHPGDSILIPGPQTAESLRNKMANTWLDVNIPAFELHIMENDSVLFNIPIRVGKAQKKYLEAAGHSVDLRTRAGDGEIIRVNRFPIFIDPVTGKKFKFTKRDDHKTTLMPQIPWLEPQINGQRYGQMIHPTTNPRSLGKAASNGCIGVGEADAWRIYYYAPVGTQVQIRYDLQEFRPNGDTLRYEDIYQLRRTGKNAKSIAVTGYWMENTSGICVCDTMF